MKKIISTDNAPKAIGPYSQAVEANNTLYISGQIPIDPMTSSYEWDTLSFSDTYDTRITNGLDVYDVRTKSDKEGIDGTKYNTW